MLQSLAFSPSVVNPSYDAFAVQDWIVNAACPLTPTERCILLAIKSHADWISGSGSYPSLATIAREAGCSRASVCRALNRFDELASLDAHPVKLRRERRFIDGQYTSNLYTIETCSLMRLPSLMVQQKLTSPNNSLRRDGDELALSFREAESEHGLAPVPEKGIQRACKPVCQADRMRELLAIRAKMLAEGRLAFPKAMPRLATRPLTPLPDDLMPRSVVKVSPTFVDSRFEALGFLGAFLASSQ
jgi:hypothetical protein